MRLFTVAILIASIASCGNKINTISPYFPTVAELDSSFISIMIDSLNHEYFGALNIGLPPEEWTNFGGWYSGEVKYSQDSLLRVYSFTGEGCGAYCSPL